MNNLFLDVLKPRRPRINYAAPAICGGSIASGYGFGFTGITLTPIPVPPGITGSYITWYGSGGDFVLSWEVYPGALCYTVYKLNDANAPFGDFHVVAECITDPHYHPPDHDPGHDPETPECYIIQAITPNGASAFSDPICTDDNDDGIPDGFPNQPGNKPGGGGGGGGTCPLIQSFGPTEVTAEEGNDVTLGNAVIDPGLAQGGGPASLIYQWLKNGVLYQDTTNTTQGSLVLNDVTDAFEGVYTLEIFSSTPTCAKQTRSVTLTVEPSTGSLDFKQLVWEAGNILPGDGTANATWGENTWMHDCGWTGGGPALPTTYNNAAMTFSKSTDTNCNLHVSITNWASVFPYNDLTTTIFIYQDGNLILDVQVRDLFLNDPINEYDIPFVVQAGTDSLIEVQVNSAITSNVGPPFKILTVTHTLTPAS